MGRQPGIGDIQCRRGHHRPALIVPGHRGDKAFPTKGVPGIGQATVIAHREITQPPATIAALEQVAVAGALDGRAHAFALGENGIARAGLERTPRRAGTGDGRQMSALIRPRRHQQVIPIVDVVQMRRLDPKIALTIPQIADGRSEPPRRQVDGATVDHLPFARAGQVTDAMAIPIQRRIPALDG